MIVPSELKNKCYVPNAIRLRIVRPEDIFLDGILGQSGRRMVKAGLLFYFTKRLAQRLIKMGVAERSK